MIVARKESNWSKNVVIARRGDQAWASVVRRWDIEEINDCMIQSPFYGLANMLHGFTELKPVAELKL